MSESEQNTAMYVLEPWHAALLDCVDRIPGRLGRGALRLEPGVAIATDGRRLVVAQTESAVGAPAMNLDKAALRTAMIVARRNPGDAQSCGVTADGRLQVRGATFDIAVVERRFPDWRAVVPEEVAAVVCLNADLLCGILRAVPEDNAGRRIVRLGHAGKNKPIVIWDAAGNTLGVLMPVDFNTEEPPEDEYRRIRQQLTSQPEAKP